MEEKTADEIAAIFSAAGDSVTVIGIAQGSDETDDDFKDKIKRNVEHLEIIKDYKKTDGTTNNLVALPCNWLVSNDNLL